LTATPSSPTRVDLSWSASADDVGVVGYDVYRNGELVGEGLTATEFADNSAVAGESYAYEVHARDAAGNEAVSNQVTVAVPEE
jgi:fibronectin type 3 domain-containing protein